MWNDLVNEWWLFSHSGGTGGQLHDSPKTLFILGGHFARLNNDPPKIPYPNLKNLWYATSHGKTDFADVTKLKLLRWKIILD